MDVTALLQIAGFAVIVAGAAVWLRSSLAKQRTNELAQLAEARGNRIEDLEAQVQRQGDKISSLEGQIEMLRKLKIDDIVEGVIIGIRSELSSGSMPQGAEITD